MLVDSLSASNAQANVLVLCEPDGGEAEILNLLSFADYRLFFAYGLAEAFEILSREPIQLIVSAVHLEDSDSYEFLNRVKTSPRWQEIPFVFLCLKRTQIASYVDHVLALAAKALGASMYASLDKHNRGKIQSDIASCLTSAQQPG